MRFLFLVMLVAASTVNIGRVDFNLEKNESAFTFLDLPDGEATLIQEPDRNILINTGNADSKKALFKRLKVFGVSHINKLVVTNAGNDYTGNVAAVIDHYNVQTLISSKAGIEKLNAQVDVQGLTVKIWKKRNKNDILPNLKAGVLDVTEEGALAVRFKYGTETVLYMGYEDAKLEQKLLGNSQLDCDILKIGEFGLNAGTIPSFLEKVDPQVAIIFHKKGRLPHNDTLEQLDTDWIDIYRMHQIGTVSIIFDSRSYQIMTFPIEKDG